MCFAWWRVTVTCFPLILLSASLQCCSWSSSSAGHGRSWLAKGSCLVSITEVSSSSSSLNTCHLFLEKKNDFERPVLVRSSCHFILYVGCWSPVWIKPFATSGTNILPVFWRFCLWNKKEVVVCLDTRKSYRESVAMLKKVQNANCVAISNQLSALCLLLSFCSLNVDVWSTQVCTKVSRLAL